MKSFTTASLVSSVLVTVASAQYAIDPQSVSNVTRASWCQSQESECPLICLQTAANSATTDANSCDPDSLTYSCVCGNGISPNVSMYSLTLPYFICQEWGNQCVSNCGSDNTCASNCRQQHPCGAQNPTRANTSTLSSTMSASASGSATNVPAGATAGPSGTVYTGFGGAAATSSSSSGGAASTGGSKSGAGRAAALEFGKAWGLVAVAGGLFGGFALLL